MLGCRSRIRINHTPESKKLVITEIKPGHVHVDSNDSTPITHMESKRNPSGTTFDAGNFHKKNDRKNGK